MRTFIQPMIRRVLALLILAGLVLYPALTQPAYAGSGIPTGFCSDKEDGNYPYPTDCTKYVACVAQTYAYEMQCSVTSDGKPLHYVQDSGPNPAESYCDYPEVAGCLLYPADESSAEGTSSNTAP